MKTIGQIIHQNKFPIRIFDDHDYTIYFENSDGYWWKAQLDSNGNETYIENSSEMWTKQEFNSNGNMIYSKSSNGVIVDNENNRKHNPSENFPT